MQSNFQVRDLRFFAAIRMVLPAIRLFIAICKLQPKTPAVGVCLEGDTTLRLRATARLYRTGRINRVIVSGGVDEPELDRLPAIIMKQRLMAMGIPQEVIDLDNQSLNTRDHALFVGDLAKNQGLSELIIITSGYHLLRAYLTFLKELLTQDCPFTIYGYPAGLFVSWFQKSPTEGHYRICNFLIELLKIRTYSDLASFDEAWQYIHRLRSTQ